MDTPREDHTPGRTPPRARIGIIGGSGLYSLSDDAVPAPVSTPYGAPSADPVLATVSDVPVAFLPRHGTDHRHPAHRINHRANLWALRSLGVRQVLAPCAVGGLRPELEPGTLVIPDQIVDRTGHGASTFYDDGAVHVPFADPYCPTGRRTVLAGAAELGRRPVDGGTMVVIPGPRFSTRAESRWHAAQGWSLVNMTGLPEAALARELALCYTCIALVTDTDAGVVEGQGVSQAEVFAAFAGHIDRLRELLYALVPALPVERTCPCPSVLDGMRLPFELPE